MILVVQNAYVDSMLGATISNFLTGAFRRSALIRIPADNALDRHFFAHVRLFMPLWQYAAV